VHRHTSVRAIPKWLGMRFLVALLTLASAAAGCAQLPMPITSGVPQTCADRLTESACKEGSRCSWVSEHKRADGTLATARCSGAEAGGGLSPLQRQQWPR
jgi:hypothetical protein